MPAAQPRPESTTNAEIAPLPSRGSAAPEGLPPARLADEQAIPAPSPVHQLQAELVLLTGPPAASGEPLYPGWFRLGFPIASSLLLWAAILWGASRLA